MGESSRITKCSLTLEGVLVKRADGREGDKRKGAEGGRIGGIEGGKKEITKDILGTTSDI